jgi:hypothetical protein
MKHFGGLYTNDDGCMVAIANGFFREDPVFETGGGSEHCV